MPFYKSLIFSIILSLAAGAVLFFMAPAVRGHSANYGLLIVDDAVPDRQVWDLLVREGFEPPLSESSQWVFLDDFEGLERVALDDYAGRLEPYDPRDDGYAAKLQSFFAAGGKRRLFIPLKAAQNITQFRSRIGAALGDIPFSAFTLNKPTGSTPLSLALLFAAAAALTLILAGDAPGSLFLLPIWVLLCRQGSTGFALSAVLAFLFRTLHDPMLELFISRHYKASRAPASNLKRGHIRFVPIRISGSVRPSAPLPWFILPFALASLAVLGLSAFGRPAGSGNPGPGDAPLAFADWEGVPLVTSADYEEHIRFQHAFSYLPLETPLEAGEGSMRLYQSYELDGTGLIASNRIAGGMVAGGPVASDIVVSDIVVRDIVASVPPFPLTELMESLEAYSFPGASDPPSGTLFPTLMVLCLSVPLFLGGLYRRRKKGKFSIYIDKRIVA
jgi:hypothetical protein